MQTILKRMGMQSEGPVIDLAVGDQVVVLIGPFADFNGIIQEIDYDKQKAKVMLSVFGRETPVELSFNEIEKASDA
jgi:transcriptional antiterminator NusG